MPRYSSPPPQAPQAPQAPAHQPGRVLRAVALTAVISGVLVLAAAAFVFSYSGIHAVAQQAGISATLARGYPVIFDALLVIACAAVLSLRGAGAVSRFYAWLSLLVLLGATAGADALHSTGTVVPQRTAALTAAIIPWILLLIGFGLLLAMLRHFRLHRAAPPAPAAVPPVMQEGRRPAALPAGPTQTARPPQLPTAPPAAASPVNVPPVDVPPAAAPPVNVPPATAPPATAPTVDVPPAAGQPSPSASSQARVQPPQAPPPPAPAPRAAAPPGSPAPAAAGPSMSVPPQAPSEQAEPISAAGRGRPAGPAAPAGPDLADLDSDPDADGPGTGDAAEAVPEEIFAAPPIADDGTKERPAGQAAAQPAFHRMWSSPTPPGDEDEG